MAKYDIDEDIRQENRHVKDDLANIASSTTKTINSIKFLAKNSGILKVVLIVALFILLIVFAFYITYFFLFGFSFKLEQDLKEYTKEAYTGKNDTYFNESGYYVYKTATEEFFFVYKRDNEVFELPLEEALKEAYCAKIMMEEKDLDISTGDALLLDDSDVFMIMEKIIEVEDKRKEETTKKYEWISKNYDYGTHIEILTDETGAFIPDEMGNVQYIEVKNDYAEWFPDDVWDDKHMSHWHKNTDEVTLKKNDIEGEVDPVTGKPRFMMSWQTIVAICEMISSQDYEDWGETGDDSKADFDMDGYSDMDGYYLNDTVVQMIIDSMAYKFEFHYNGFETDPWYNPWASDFYDYEEMKNIAYRLEIQEMPPSPTPGDVAFIKKTPEQAPVAISNIYENYFYHYEDISDGYGKKICTGRSKYVNAVAFVELMQEVAPQFDFDEFIEIIEHFPYAEEEVEKYRKLKGIYEWQMETGEPYFIEEENLPCFSSGVRLGEDCEYIEGSEIIPPNFPPLFGDNYLDGDFEYVYIDGPKYGGGWHRGWYAISEAARIDLSQSDNLSKAQIESLLKYLWVRCGSNPDTPFYEATDRIYRWQQDGGGSVTGVLGLWIHEGSLTRAIGLNAWNFSNMVASSGEPYYTSKNGRHWTDFKTMYDNDIGMAMVAQFQRISRNYWNRNGIKQNTYFAMSFLTQGGIYSAQSPEEVCDTSYFTHCYCPFWDDNGFGVSPEKTPNPAYTGWANGCALYKEQLYSIAAGS